MKISLKNLTELSFLAAIASLPLYMARFHIFGIPTNISETLALISILLFVFQHKRGSFLQLVNIRQSVFWPTLILVTATATSAFCCGNYSSHGLGIIKGWFIIPIVFSFFSSVLFADGKGIRKIFYAIFISTFCVSLISIFYALNERVTYDGRLKAFYLSPNHLSMFLIFGIFVFIYLYSTEKYRSVKILLSFSLICLLFSVYKTFSYSVWLSSSTALFFSLSILGKFPRKRLILGSLIAIFLLFISLQANSSKLRSSLDEKSSVYSRMVIWKSSLKMASDNPVFGIGPGNFQTKYLQYQQYYPSYPEWAVPQPHNIYMAFWLQSGMIGLLSFIYISLLSIRTTFKIKNVALAAALLSGIFYVLFHGAVDTPFWKNDLSYIFWLFVFVINSQKIKNQAYK